MFGIKARYAYARCALTSVFFHNHNSRKFGSGRVLLCFMGVEFLIDVGRNST